MSFEQYRNLKVAFGKLSALTSRLRRAVLCLGMVLPTLLAWGCSGIVSGQNTTPSQPPPQTFSISGTITPVTGGNGATITITGAANATATANSSGNFTVSGLANGTYTITPSRAGYSFNPSSMNVTISNASVTTGISFTATALTFGISGTLSPVAGGSGATVTLGGAASATTTADGAGNYSFSGLANGTYTVTPSHTGYTFNPSVQTATVNGANVTGVNFTAQGIPTFNISGTISPVTGGSGATVTLSGAASATTTSDGAGNYSFSGLANGTYTVTPSHTGYTFNPSVQTATVNGANVTGVNFTAQSIPTFNISGTISPVTGGSGSTVNLSGAAVATTISDSAGNYTFAGLSNGTYAVTPSHAGYTFNPSVQAATVNGANVTGVNFTAQSNPTFSISGTISPVTGGSGSTVTLSGAAAATTVTDASGNYIFSGLANGTYTVTPTNTGYTFSPVNQNVMVNGANQTAVNFTATAQVPHTVALSWTASTSTVASYNLYRSTVNGTGYVKLGSTLATVLSYTDTTVQNGTTYYYVTTAVDSTGAESLFSNQATAVIP